MVVDYDHHVSLLANTLFTGIKATFFRTTKLALANFKPCVTSPRELPPISFTTSGVFKLVVPFMWLCVSDLLKATGNPDGA